MAFTKRREYLFLYTVKDANPNGNPLEANHPRYDEDTQQALASDVRIKRTIRDEWLREGLNVFIDGKPKTLKDRFNELKEIAGKNTGREIMAECIDTRLFGITFALGKEAFAWTGPVQFKWARSLHAATFEFIQGTSAFATEGKEGVEKQQRSFRNEYKVPFALMAVYAIANQFASEDTYATDNDLDLFFNALWLGTDNLITRSKNEHKSRFLMEITYKPGFKGKIGALDEKVELLKNDKSKPTIDEQKALRNLSEVIINASSLAEAIAKNNNDIEKIKLMQDEELKILGLEQLSVKPEIVETR